RVGDHVGHLVLAAGRVRAPDGEHLVEAGAHDGGRVADRLGALAAVAVADPLRAVITGAAGAAPRALDGAARAAVIDDDDVVVHARTAVVAGVEQDGGDVALAA